MRCPPFPPLEPRQPLDAQFPGSTTPGFPRVLPLSEAAPLSRWRCVCKFGVRGLARGTPSSERSLWELKAGARLWVTDGCSVPGERS